jgi:uncharacterized protein YdaU (DUF1376 family)
MQAPYFPLYSKDTLAEVSWMSNEEAGAWLRLHLQAWEQEPKGTLPNDETLLTRFAQTSPSKWQEIKLAAMFGFTLGEDGRWHCATLEKAFQDAVDSHSKRQEAANHRWRKSNADAMDMQSISNADTKQCYSESESESESEEVCVIESVREGGVGGDAPKSEPKPSRSAQASRSRRSNVCDDEYLKSLQAKDVYSALNVKKIYGKMCAWCEVKGKAPTRSRLINWLNGEDVPMNGSGARRRDETDSGMVY